MVFQIHNAGDGPDPMAIVQQIRDAIAANISAAEIQVEPKGPGHFEIRVNSSIFEGQSRVKQHQLVYGAIWHLMAGNEPPIHAIDRLECVIPKNGER